MCEPAGSANVPPSQFGRIGGTGGGVEMMGAARGVRGIVAGVFVIGATMVGFAANAVSAGAGVAGIPCEVQDGRDDVAPAQDGQVVSCAQLEVTKVVTGTPAPSPAPGTTFDVVVDCVPTETDGMVPEDGVEAEQAPPGQSPPFTTTLTFPEGGGTQSVFIDRPSECAVSETPPAGCTLSSIDPATTAIEDPILYPVTVTNNCDPPVEAAEAAEAVVGVPTFTG
jgi:hypothetical protein